MRPKWINYKVDYAEALIYKESRVIVDSKICHVFVPSDPQPVQDFHVSYKIKSDHTNVNWSTFGRCGMWDLTY